VSPSAAVPDIPWDLVDEARRRTRLVWDRQDLDLREPALAVTWDRPDQPPEGRSSMADCFRGPVRRMVEDPAEDLRHQLQAVRHGIEHLEAGRDVGMPLANHFCLHGIHFGTGPLATAFGSRMIVRDDEVVFYEPAVHTPAEALRLRPPDLHRSGVLPTILDRIEYYNEATGGRVPVTVCDTALPWSIATQVWHYEDMLEATLTAPGAVRHVLDLVTEAIIEWDQIQKTRMLRWTGSDAGVPNLWTHRGTYKGDDCMVAVSPATWEEFFLPYNARVSAAKGGLCYHCCRRHDFQFPGMVKTPGFMGLDADPAWNDVELIARALDGRGVWAWALGYVDEESFPMHLEWIRRMRGRVGLFLRAHGRDRAQAVLRARRLREAIASGEGGSPHA